MEQRPALEGSQVTATTSIAAGLAQAGLQTLLDATSRGVSAFNRVAPSSAQPPYPDAIAALHPSQAQFLLSQILLGQQPGGPAMMASSQGLPSLPDLPPAPVAGGGRARQARSSGAAVERPGPGPGAGAGTTYASRHQQAEARRRSRINERLDALRKLVPHTERANTASFLEDVVVYVQQLQRRVVALEAKLGLPPSVVAPPEPLTFGDSSPTATATAATGLSNISAIDRMALQALLQQAAAGSAGLAAAAPPPRPAALPSASEELAMAAQLAPVGQRERAMMAESQPAGQAGGEAGGATHGGRDGGDVGGLQGAELQELIRQAAAGLQGLVAQPTQRADEQGAAKRPRQAASG
jgi:hypothetical protein